MSRLIPLLAWADSVMSPAPSAATLRRWVKAKRIQPAPVKIGRGYYVPQDAVYTQPDSLPDLLEKIRADREKAHARPLA